MDIDVLAARVTPCANFIRLLLYRLSPLCRQGAAERQRRPTDADGRCAVDGPAADTAQRLSGKAMDYFTDATPRTTAVATDGLDPGR